MSGNVSEAQLNGAICAKQPLIKAMRFVKKESLNLISSWISHESSDPNMVVDTFIDPLIDAVLLDYQKNVHEARKSEVFFKSAMAKINLNMALPNMFPKYLMLFLNVRTLVMINRDFEEYPEPRKNFFMLLQEL